MQYERFWSKVKKPDGPDGCWLWTSSITRVGYGQFKQEGLYIGAHRVAYQICVGYIPKDLQIDHLCRVRHCVNPAHMELVTQQENIRRGAASRKAEKQKALAEWLHDPTRCPKGHRLDEIRYPSGQIAGCRTCQKEKRRLFDSRATG